MQKGLQLVFLILLIPCNTFAQSLSFYDKETGKSIDGLVVEVTSINSKTFTLKITDSQGKVNVEEASFPLILSTSHLGYEVFRDTLFSADDFNFYLLPIINQLEEVIVTGQFTPQSARNSVFRVQTIDAVEIQKRGALTLEEALTSQLNIRVSQDLALGSASISMQGISSQNVKVLIDGVPLVNRVGNGNGADLSQISLQNIARIEIVEGPMAVNFGANALAGVINLITKKDFKNKTEIGAYFQTESVGNEYGLDKGRHIQSLSLNHRFDPSWSVLLNAQHNDFLGFQGNANPRQHEWNPKEQWTGNALLKYELKNHSIHYRLDALDQVINDFGSPQNNFQPDGQNQPFAIDESFHSKRLTHQLQSEGKLPFLDRYSAFASYSDFERQKTRFSKNLVTNQERLTTGEGDQDLSTYRVWEFGGTGFLKSGNSNDFQLGYQLSFEEVGGGRIQEGQQNIEEYAIYALSELNLSKFTLRPGIRYTYNSTFGAQLIPSLQLKYDASELARFRVSLGKGFRSPSVRELYFEFIDSNHRIFGNPDLKPEKSNHVSLNILSQYKIASNLVKLDLNFFFNDIEDQISIGQNVNDNTSTTYLNIDRFKTLGASINQSLAIGSFSGRLGFSYIGRYNQISEEDQDLSSFFYSPELNSNLSYELPNKASSLSLFYKYTGRVQAYFTDTNDQNEQVTSIGEIKGYHWVDATAVHSINKAFDLAFGARNLLNIKQVNNSGISGGAHSGGASVPVSYGRSYFLKLSYKLNLK
uniref:TonB-dependent receptor plug domain-containing protein n=3 Tax=Roseivirga sp. TaxID=1964215 RepID=UPI00404722AD